MESHSLNWSDEWLLGYTPMDLEHEEFVKQIACMQQANETELLGLLDSFYLLAKQHFEAENNWMTQTQFPPRDCHIDEHNAVLRSIEEVRQLLSVGRVDVARSLVAELVNWFPGHATHLDSALAHWMFKQKNDGKPVVIRRGLNFEKTS